MKIPSFTIALIIISALMLNSDSLYAFQNNSGVGHAFKKGFFPDRGVSFTDQSLLLDGFIHNRNLPEPDTEGLSGAAWLDYDDDSDLDLFLPNGKAGLSALFRNNGDGTFTDVAAEAGVQNDKGSSGVVVGDLDNNNYPDIFLTGEGHFALANQSPPVLYLNNGDGTFTDVSDVAGIPGAETALGAAMGDINNDGYLDIFITSPGHLGIVIGEPVQHENKLYLNNGLDADGNISFTDISESAGVNDALGACVVSFSDYDKDGLQDIFVGNCNDVTFLPTPFHLYRNNGDLTFTDIATEAGLNEGGYWMAIALGDYNNDGNIDLFATNFGPTSPIPGAGKHALFRNNGNGTFTNIAADVGLAAEWEFSWGATLEDFDNDGYLDLYFAGALPTFGLIGPGLANPGRLFFNDRKGGFNQASLEDSGGDLSSRYTSGVAQGDFNGDGFADIIVMTETLLDPSSGEVADLGTPVLLRNEGNRNNWLTVRTKGTTSNRSGIGARVHIFGRGGLHQVREVRAGSSFASSESPWPSFGLGKHRRVSVLVLWPSGSVEFFGVHKFNKFITVVEGEGRWRYNYR